MSLSRRFRKFRVVLSSSNSQFKTMNLPARSRLGHEIPFWVSDGSFFFITINCEPRKENQFCNQGTGRAVLAAAAHNHRNVGLALSPHAVDAGPSPCSNRFSARSRNEGGDYRTGNGFWRGMSKLSGSVISSIIDCATITRRSKKSGYILMNPVRRGLCVTG